MRLVLRIFTSNGSHNERERPLSDPYNVKAVRSGVLITKPLPERLGDFPVGTPYMTPQLARASAVDYRISPALKVILVEWAAKENAIILVDDR